MEAFPKVGDQNFPKKNVDGGSNYQKGHSNHNGQLLKSKYLKRKENVIYSSLRRRKILFLSKRTNSLKSIKLFFDKRSCIFGIVTQNAVLVSEIRTVCSPTERSSWVLRAEP